MTTIAVTVKLTSDTTPDMSTVHTFTHGSTEALDGMQHTAQLHYVLNAIDDLLTSLLSGEAS